MKAVFLDRDGVINENRPDHVKSLNEFKFLPGVLEALRALSQSDFLIFVITNQAVINRGLVPKLAVDEINRYMLSEIQRFGGRVEEILYCPHRAEERCECRKPRPGLMITAAEAYRLDLSRSYVVGDALTDMEAGRAANCQNILVMTGRGSAQLALASTAEKRSFRIVPDLASAVEMITRMQEARKAPELIVPRG